MRILGIETSCDETGIALVEATGGLAKPRFRVLKNLVASQIKIHRPFGGVVPMLAKREHEKNLPILYRQIFTNPESETPNSKSCLLNSIDLIAVTVGPGLEPALWAGISFAKSLANARINADRDADKRGYIGVNLRKNQRTSAYQPQLVGANHLEGHLYSFLLPRKASPQGKPQKNSHFSPLISHVFPAIALIVSGGHTILLYVESLTKWKKLGETRDDAIGEAFDKVARLLGLPYPGGPQLEKLALSLPKGEAPSINFPRPMLRSRDWNFSFSGLKTSVFYFLRDNPKAKKADVAASFQKAAVDVLTAKTIEAARSFRVKSAILSGGVAANQLLRSELEAHSKKFGLKFLFSDPEYNTDNAVMIAAAGYMSMLRGKKYPLRANGNLGI